MHDWEDGNMYDITDIPMYVCLGACVCLLGVSMPLDSRPWSKKTALIFNSLGILEVTRDSNQPHSVRLIRWEVGVRENLRALFVHFWAGRLDGGGAAGARWPLLVKEEEKRSLDQGLSCSARLLGPGLQTSPWEQGAADKRPSPLIHSVISGASTTFDPRPCWEV